METVSGIWASEGEFPQLLAGKLLRGVLRLRCPVVRLASECLLVSRSEPERLSGTERIHMPACRCWPADCLKKAAHRSVHALEISLVKVQFCISVKSNTTNLYR